MGGKIVCQNKKAYHDYHIEHKIEAGMVLNGPEVKSLRAGRANLKDGYVRIDEKGDLTSGINPGTQYLFRSWFTPRFPRR